LTSVYSSVDFVGTIGKEDFWHDLLPTLSCLKEFVELESCRYKPEVNFKKLLIENKPEDITLFKEYFNQVYQGWIMEGNLSADISSLSLDDKAKSPYDLYISALTTIIKIAKQKVDTHPEINDSLVPRYNQKYYKRNLANLEEMVRDSKLYFEGVNYQPQISIESPISIMGSVVDQLMDLTQNGMGEIRYQYPKEDFQILTDPVILKHTFFNFLTNADKYGIDTSGKKQPITIIIDHVDGQTIISIIDQGMGMSPDKINDIKNKIPGRDKNARESNIPGSGFGLVQIVEMVENHLHGEVEITSEINKGTAITLILPDLELPQ